MMAILGLDVYVVSVITASGFSVTPVTHGIMYHLDVLGKMKWKRVKKENGNVLVVVLMNKEYKLNQRKISIKKISSLSEGISILFIQMISHY